MSPWELLFCLGAVALALWPAIESGFKPEGLWWYNDQRSNQQTTTEEKCDE